MKEFKLIAFEDLRAIADYMDTVGQLFPVDSIAALKEKKDRAFEGLSRNIEAGNEGRVHAKLDAIYEELQIINGRAQFAEQVAGPAPVRVLRVVPPTVVGPRNRVPRNLTELEADLPGADLEFDGEGGGVE